MLSDFPISLLDRWRTLKSCPVPLQFHPGFPGTPWEELATSADSWQLGGAGQDDSSWSRALQAGQTSAACTEPRDAPCMSDPLLLEPTRAHGTACHTNLPDLFHGPRQVSRGPP